MKKRVLSILLTLVMLIGMMPLAAIPAFAEGDTVSYLDEYGRTQSRAAADVTEITEGKEYGAGWYILKGNFTGEDSLSQITFTGETHLILADGADVTVFGGILLSNMDASLTIYAQPVENGTGKLTVNNAPDYYPGIGSGERGECGDITINGGIVTANGGYHAAGIGSGWYGSCGDITINGGTVTATSLITGAGIGSGARGSCGNITINGGTVTATSEASGAGIGSGYDGSCGDITINGGTVTANGGDRAAGIGSGNAGSYAGTCADITINGGIITAIGGYDGAGIGTGCGSKWITSSEGTIRITDGIITAIGGYHAAGIGTGYEGSFAGGITISGGYIKAKAGEHAERIGAGYGGSCGSVNYGSCLTKDKDGCLYVNYEPFAGTEATCTQAGNKEYIQELRSEAYYSALPVTAETLIPDLAAWKAEGGDGYIAPLGHYDNDGDGLCDCCGKHYVSYYDYDPATKQMTEKAHLASAIDGTTSTLTDGWYVVKGNVEIPDSLRVSGDVHLILADDATLTVKKGVLLTEGNSLTIYVQSFENHMGSLVATGNSVEHIAYSAGIGGYVDIEKDQRFSSGRLTVNGGNITATGADASAGIGGSEWTDCSEVTINAGTVTATGGNGGAGIGGGLDGSLRKLTVNGGTVTARGGYGGAGIGGGLGGDGGQVQINGGTVKLYGGEESAAFGKAYYGDGSAATVRIGGAMEAYEIIDRPLSYDPSRTKEVLGDQLTVNADGKLAVGTCLKAIVWPITPNDGPVTPDDPIEHLHLGMPVPGLEPTENNAGHEEYYQCSRCGKNFEDEACTVEIADLDAWKAKGGSGYLAPLSDKDDPTAPKTGDNSNIALWMTLFVLSSTVLCCCGIIGRKRKNEQ